jgi:hypothetical protein
MKATLFFLAAAAAFAQQPAVENAKLETRAFAGSLATQLSQFGSGPFWAGYSEPAIPWNHLTNQSDGWCSPAPGTPLRLEGSTALVVLIRVEAAASQIKVVSPDCKLDAGGLPFYWINNVPPAASIAWLKTQITAQQRADRAIYAIALHDGRVADQALDDLTAITQPDKVRERTAFWLGNSRGAHGIEVLKRMLANDPNDKVREQVVFALAQSKDPAGIASVIDVARSDRSPRVRSRALFWLAQKAGNKQAAGVIDSAVANDPDRAVKEQAVFALQQLPPDQGIPLLINIAKSNSDPAVRKKAMFWLGQSKDPRALDFLAQVLKQ